MQKQIFFFKWEQPHTMYGLLSFMYVQSKDN